MAREGDVREPGVECVVTVPSLGDRLEFVDVSSDLILSDVEVSV